MTGRATLALLIPAYNAAAFLPRILASAAAQTEPFDEIWVYDDCSTDDTAAVAERLGARLVRGEVNRGCTHAKSVLVERATSDWIHFHDADDLLLPNFTEIARRWLSPRDVDVVVFGCEERWEDSRQLISITIPDDADLADDPVGWTIRNKINAISGLYRRSAFTAAGGFDLDPEVHYNEDQACHCKLARGGLRFRADPTVAVVNLRRHSSMWTANQGKAIRAHYFVMKKAASAPGGYRHRNAIAANLWEAATGAASQQDWKTADDAARLAMTLGGHASLPPGVLFQSLCRVSPYLALRIREWLIRILKPRFREGFPGWRAPVNLF